MKVKIDGKKIDAKLPKKFKKDWIKALRSGDYSQGNGKLVDSENNYCCLGVACRVAGYNNGHIKRSSVEEINKNAYISNEFKKIPKILKGGNSLTKKLADMNDSGRSFKYIASYIERYL